MHGDLLKFLSDFNEIFQLKRRNRKCSRKEDVLRFYVVLKFVLMNHKYCERFRGKFEKDIGKITSLLYVYFLIFKMGLLTLAL